MPRTNDQPSGPPPTAAEVQALAAVAVQYRIEHVPFSVGHDYRILDAGGDLSYFVDGKFLSPPRRLSFQDARGNELAQVRDKFLAARARFEVLQDGAVVATIRQRFFSLVWLKHTVCFANGQELETHSGTETGECLCRAGQPVAQIKREPGLCENFTVNVHPAEDPVLMLASVIAILEFRRQAESSG